MKSGSSPRSSVGQRRPAPERKRRRPTPVDVFAVAAAKRKAKQERAIVAPSPAAAPSDADLLRALGQSFGITANTTPPAGSFTVRDFAEANRCSLHFASAKLLDAHTAGLLTRVMCRPAGAAKASWYYVRAGGVRPS